LGLFRAWVLARWRRNTPADARRKNGARQTNRRPSRRRLSSRLVRRFVPGSQAGDRKKTDPPYRSKRRKRRGHPPFVLCVCFCYYPSHVPSLRHRRTILVRRAGRLGQRQTARRNPAWPARSCWPRSRLELPHQFHHVCLAVRRVNDLKLNFRPNSTVGHVPALLGTLAGRLGIVNSPDQESGTEPRF
jgi:hypothetical protein